jgi:hypothetical protein
MERAIFTICSASRQEREGCVHHLFNLKTREGAVFTIC